MVQIDPYNATNVMDGDTFKIIYLKFMPIVYVAKAEGVVKAHTLAEDPALDCYRPELVFIRKLM